MTLSHCPPFWQGPKEDFFVQGRLPFNSDDFREWQNWQCHWVKQSFKPSHYFQNFKYDPCASTELFTQIYNNLVLTHISQEKFPSKGHKSILGTSFATFPAIRAFEENVRSYRWEEIIFGICVQSCCCWPNIPLSQISYLNTNSGSLKIAN